MTFFFSLESSSPFLFSPSLPSPHLLFSFLPSFTFTVTTFDLYCPHLLISFPVTLFSVLVPLVPPLPVFFFLLFSSHTSFCSRLLSFFLLSLYLTSVFKVPTFSSDFLLFSDFMCSNLHYSIFIIIIPSLCSFHQSLFFY